MHLEGPELAAEVGPERQEEDSGSRYPSSPPDPVGYGSMTRWRRRNLHDSNLADSVFSSGLSKSYPKVEAERAQKVVQSPAVEAAVAEVEEDSELCRDLLASMALKGIAKGQLTRNHPKGEPIETGFLDYLAEYSHSKEAAIAASPRDWKDSLCIEMVEL